MAKKPAINKPALPSELKNSINSAAGQVQIEFKGFVPAMSIKLKEEDYNEIIEFFSKPENYGKYCVLKDKESFLNEEGEGIQWDRGWGTDIYACIIRTMPETPAEKRTKYNDWWNFPEKEKTNRNQKIPDEENQCYKGTVTAEAAASSHALDVWASLNQLGDISYNAVMIFIGIRQVQWSRKNTTFKGNYESYDTIQEADAAYAKDSSKGRFYERHTMNLTDWLE